MTEATHPASAFSRSALSASSVATSFFAAACSSGSSFFSFASCENAG